MFTGLIQAKADVVGVERIRDEMRLVLSCGIIKDISVGESISVNGVCLSVEDVSEHFFKVYASHETLSKTNLKYLRQKEQVNIERAMRIGDRFGGHIVTGHIDCLSKIEKMEKIGESFIYRFSFPEEFSCYVVEKGSIALDGISLTINKCGNGYFEVNIIPITYRETNISLWEVGRLVNTEFDIIGKYVARMFDIYAGAGPGKGEGVISFDFLREHGFI